MRSEVGFFENWRRDAKGRAGRCAFSILVQKTCVTVSEFLYVIGRFEAYSMCVYNHFWGHLAGSHYTNVYGCKTTVAYRNFSGPVNIGITMTGSSSPFDWS